MTRSFTDLGVSSELADVLAHAGIDTPFPIQDATIPAALDGRDLCGRAPTGSGKTLAFALPVAARVQRARPNRPRALILTPTRELAGQIHEVLEPLAASRSRRVASIYGGTNIRRDIAQLARGVDVVVGTPGRLADLVRRDDLRLGEVDVVVIDEADRMADMGFLPQVRELLDETSADRQTLLYSATLDGDVDVLVRNYQRDPVRHEVDQDAEEAGDVEHLFWSVSHRDRRRVAGEIARSTSPALIFTRTKRGADRLAKNLSKDGISTAAIHGNRSQNQRERALERFANGRVEALVATDVAARGIHVDDVAIVVHYDLPATEKDYVHRSGRTGRAGATGRVISLVVEDSRTDAHGIQRHLGMERALHPVDLDALHRRPTARARNEDRDRSGDRSPRNGRSRSSGSGRVKWFNPMRGYGFIAGDDGGEDLFVHVSEIRGSHATSLADGQRVRFTPKSGPKGLQATAVTTD